LLFQFEWDFVPIFSSTLQVNLALSAQISAKTPANFPLSFFAKVKPEEKERAARNFLKPKLQVRGGDWC